MWCDSDIELNLPDPEIKIIWGERVLQNKMETHVINNRARTIATSFPVFVFILAPADNPFIFYHDSNRKELKYCSGGFHGSDNLFTNMQVRGRKDVCVCLLTSANVTPLTVMFFKTW